MFKRALPLLERSFPLLERVLGIKIGKEGTSFLGSASAVIIGLVMAKVFSTLLYLFSGRMLPKDEFGNYALALSVGSFIIMPMLLGIDTAMTRFMSRSKKLAGEYVTTAYVMVAVFMIITSVVFYLLRSTLSDLLDIGSPILGLSLLLAVVMVAYYLAEKTLQGRQQMSAVGIIKTVCALGGLLVAVLLIILGGRHYYYLGLGIATGFLLAAVLGIILSAEGTFKWAPGGFTLRAKELLKYGMFATLAGVSSVVLYNFDKIIVGSYLGPEAVGTYFAYSLSSLGGIGILAMGVTFALFPRISEKSRAQKRNAFYTLGRLTIRLLPAALMMVFIGQVVFLAIMGRYELQLGRLILFSLYGTMTAMAGVYSWFASSDKVWGIRGVGITTASAAALFLASSMLWLHTYGIDGIVFAATVSFGLANVSYIMLSHHVAK